MELNEYQNRAMSYRLPTSDEMYARYNLMGEVGELFSLIAKSYRDGLPPDYEELFLKELGDILWHVAAIADDKGFSLDSVAQANIDKLEDRYQRGKIGGSGDTR